MNNNNNNIDMNNIEYFSHDKYKDIFTIFIYDLHVWINLESGLTWHTSRSVCAVLYRAGDERRWRGA